MELRHAQKLQSIGRLASGIAHEINTPIQFIGDSLHFVRDALAALEPLIRAYQEVCAAAGAADASSLARVRTLELESDLDYVLENVPRACDRALTGIERVAGIVHAMRRFASPGSGEMVSTDLNEAIRTTLTVARNEYRYVAEIVLELAPLPAIACQAADVRQVLLSLVVNAADAIAAVTGTDRTGRIVVRSSHDGDGVSVSIADSGCGIPEEHRDHIFEPFFTTKDAARRMGYDLATARYIVERHRGRLSFDSTPGQGTTFTLWLPLDGTAAGSEAES
jgi:signal transduction histidine kinase